MHDHHVGSLRGSEDGDAESHGGVRAGVHRVVRVQRPRHLRETKGEGERGGGEKAAAGGGGPGGRDGERRFRRGERRG